MLKASIIIPIIRTEKALDCMKAIHQNAGIPDNEYEVISEVDVDHIGCPKMVAKLTEKTRSERVMFLGDDTLPQKDFLRIALEKMDTLPGRWGVVGLNTQDIHRGEKGNPLPHWLADKRMLKHIPGGQFFPVEYRHSYGDNELKDIADELGRWVEAEDAKIIHTHPINASAEYDEGYQKAYSDGNIIHDQKIYFQRKRERMTKKYGVKLAIALPLTDKWVSNEFFFSFLKVLTTFMVKHNDVSVDILAPDYPAHIDDVRNNLVSKAMNVGSTHILFMDTDQIYETPDMIERLLAHKKPVVATRVHKRYPPFSPVLLRGELGKLEIVPDKEIKPDGFESELPIEYSGTGCVLISTDILIDMYPEKPFHSKLDERGKPIGEDIYFFQQLKDRNIPVIADCSIDIPHLTWMATGWGEWKLFQKLKFGGKKNGRQ